MKFYVFAYKKVFERIRFLYHYELLMFRSLNSISWNYLQCAHIAFEI